jgi:hypothetical protein
MAKIRFLRLGQMQGVGTSGNTTGSLRLPIGPTYLGIIFLLSSTTTGLPAAWSGNDYVRTLFNSKIGTQSTMRRIGHVQDARQIGPINSITDTTALKTLNSITWPMSGALRDVTPTGPFAKSAFVLNFGQENAAGVLSRRFLALNTAAQGFATFDLEIQLGAYTTPQITVVAIIDDEPTAGQSTEVISMIREKTWDLQSSGEKVFTDLPAYSYRSLWFDGLDGNDEGFALSVNNLERVNTIDNGLAGNRATFAATLTAFFGVAGFQTIDENANLVGSQGIIFDAAGNADSLLTIGQQDNVQLRFNVNAATALTGCLEIVGNPLTT